MQSECTEDIFAYMSSCTGSKSTFGEEPFTKQRTLVSDVGLTDCISHSYGRTNGSYINTRKVCDVMVPVLKEVKKRLSRTGIYLDEEDIETFELNDTKDRVHREGIRALSLGNLSYGMISFSDDELFFQLHPNKYTWKVKAQEMYGFEHLDVFNKAFSLRCGRQPCEYMSYFSDVVDGNGPAVLPAFIRKGLINDRMDDYMRRLNAFVMMNQNGHYPALCLPCLLHKQVGNRFSKRLTYDPMRPQLNPFTVIDLENKPDEAGTSRARFIENYIKQCQESNVCGSDLYVKDNMSYYLTRLPFRDIEICVSKEDEHYVPENDYIVRWRRRVTNEINE